MLQFLFECASGALQNEINNQKKKKIERKQIISYVF